MTITGCAKYTKYFEKLKFPIILIEEAAEVLESHCISAIMSKHL
jgi:hypothetical protein